MNENENLPDIMRRKSLPSFALKDLAEMAKIIVESKLFGFTSVPQVVTIMLLAEAEGIHPLMAIRDYHIIDSKPSLKTEAMVTNFQRTGGRFKILELSDQKCSVTFSHPKTANEITVTWDIERAKRAGIYKEKTVNGNPGMWVRYPRQMLRNRTMAEGIRAIYPRACAGMYSDLEQLDFDSVVEGTELQNKIIETEPDNSCAQINGAAPVIGFCGTMAPPAYFTGDDIGSVITKEVTKKDGTKWTRYGIQIAGNIYGTFSKSIYDNIINIKQNNKKFSFESKMEDNRQTIVSVDIVAEDDFQTHIKAITTSEN